jgi:uncharacterized protein YndB with AHSA1/START domain
MPQTQVIAPIELIVNRTFQAPIEKVFRAWTDPDALDRWFSPTDDVTISSSVDLRVGGAYRIEIIKSDGTSFLTSGTYLEVQPPHRLAFTWSGGCKLDGHDTLVTIEFYSIGNATQVTLTHQNFSSDDSRNKHEHGWNGCLDRLAKIL